MGESFTIIYKAILHLNNTFTRRVIMKVLHITTNYPTERYPIYGIFVKEQIESLSNIGIKNEIFLFNGKGILGKFQYIPSFLKLCIRLRKNRYDLIHCHHALSAICYLLTFNKHKLVVSFQNDPINELGLWVFTLIKKRANALIFKNKSLYLLLKNAHYIPNGVNTNLFRPISKKEACKYLNLDDKNKYALFVSSNFIRKQKRYDRFKLVLKILNDKYGIELKEILLINTKREVVPYYINASTIHILTSDFEGSPNSVKECMACNIPVVSTPVGNVKDLFADLKGYYISKSFEINELTELVFKSLNLKTVTGRTKLIEKNLDLKSVAKKINELYISIIK